MTAGIILISFLLLALCPPLVVIYWGLLIVYGVSERKQKRKPTPAAKARTASDAEKARILREREKERKAKADAKIARAEQRQAQAQTIIDHLEPKRAKIIEQIEKIKFDRYKRTADGHYASTDEQIDKEIEKLEDKLFDITRKIEAARFTYEQAERERSKR